MNSKQQRYIRFAQMSIRCGEYPYHPEEEKEYQKDRDLTDEQMQECREILALELRQIQRKQSVDALKALIKSGAKITIKEEGVPADALLEEVEMLDETEVCGLVRVPGQQEEGITVVRETYVLTFPLKVSLQTV